MKLFQLINSLEPEISPNHCKVHLAVSTSGDDPLDLYFSGDFDEWQTWKKHQDFERAFVLSLIQLPEHSKWLFVGVFDSQSSVWHQDEVILTNGKHGRNIRILNGHSYCHSYSFQNTASGSLSASLTHSPVCGIKTRNFMSTVCFGGPH